MMWRNTLLAFAIAIGYLITSSASSTENKVAQKYYCNGECGVERERCSCKSTCRKMKNCCLDYTESCLKDGTSWMDESCARRKDMVCPDGYQNTVLMMSIDGFHDSYFNRGLTPVISKLANCGVTSQMIPQYPTKTLPNHYTMATGLYLESHGIIGNNMYNHDTGEEFIISQPSSYDPIWWKGEPIWVTVSKAGLKTAAYFWPGSDVNITRYPDYWVKYNGSIAPEERVYTLLDWLKLDTEQRPRMIVMYYIVVDTAGHHSGPDSTELGDSLVQADKMVGMVMNGLFSLDLHNCIDVMVMSDHGMADIDCENKVTYLENFGVDISEVYWDLGVFGRIGKSPNKSLGPGFDADKWKKKLQCKRDETHFEVFLKHEYFPKRYHYANNPLIEDVQLVVDVGWWVAGNPSSGPDCILKGDHGYDNQYDEMMAIFVAHGPNFKRGYNRSEPFENIELYNLCADLLHIDRADNNGTKGALYDVMSSPPELEIERNSAKLQFCDIEDMGVTFPSNPNNVLENNYQEWNGHYRTARLLDDDFNCCMIHRQAQSAIYDRNIHMVRLKSFLLWGPESAISSHGSCKYGDGDVASRTNVNDGIDFNEEARRKKYDFSATMHKLDDINSHQERAPYAIPVYSAFFEVWTYMEQRIREWTERYNGILVHMGPIFDYNHDGLSDDNDTRFQNGTRLNGTVMPTHIYLMMLRCKNSSSESHIVKCTDQIDNIDVLSFIIPNYRELPCFRKAAEKLGSTWISHTLKRHVARIRDIELLTNISFFTNFITNQSSDGNHLKAIRKKLYIPRESSSEWLKDFTRTDKIRVEEGGGPQSNPNFIFSISVIGLITATAAVLISILKTLHHLQNRIFS